MTSLASKLTIRDLADDEFNGKRVLIRVDFNVPQKKDGSGEITNTARIDAAMPTIKYALERNARVVVLMSHLGRPDGQAKPEFTLRPCLEVVKQHLGYGDDKALFAPNCIGDEALNVINNAPHGSIVLLENLRFHLEEEGKGVVNKEKIKASPEAVAQFRKALTANGDLYINDAFGTAHRGHASMIGIDLPRKAAGLLMAKELEYFAAALENPSREFVAILGGSKVSDKIQLIKNMVGKVDKLIICGGMAFTFKKVDGVQIGGSLFDEPGANTIPEFRTADNADKFIYPIDYIVAPKFKPESPEDFAQVTSKTDSDGIPEGWLGLDVGPRSRELFRRVILDPNTKTILWNGPPGVFEQNVFAEASKDMLRACKEAIRQGKKVIVGGGDTATVVSQFSKIDLDPTELSHVSTGGGASLELLEGKPLPGVDSLDSK